MGKVGGKSITIEVTNAELDAFEDYCVVDFEGDLKEEERCRKVALKIWQRLVNEQ